MTSNRIPAELKGEVLVCSCHPERCHGHFLAKLANEYTASECRLVMAHRAHRTIAAMSHTLIDENRTQLNLAALKRDALERGWFEAYVDWGEWTRVRGE